MKILVYGAGNIGSLYAGLLGHAGHQVTMVASEGRARSLEQYGLLLRNEKTGHCAQYRPKVVEQLASTEAFDWAFVAMARRHMDEALAALAANRHIPSVLFLGNNLTGAQGLTDALGASRVVLGFPGAAAVQDGKTHRYVITSEREQPTTVGELSGRETARLTRLIAALGEAGFSVRGCSQMDAWLKTHAAEVCPTVYALYGCGCSAQRLSEQRQLVFWMIRAIRENYRVLLAHGVPIVPSNRRLVRWLPEWVLVQIACRLLTSPATELKLAHARQARLEMHELSSELFNLAAQAHLEVPCMRRLVELAEPEHTATSQTEDANSESTDRSIHGAVPHLDSFAPPFLRE